FAPGAVLLQTRHAPVVAGSREESGCTGIGPCVAVGALAPGAVLLQKGHAPAVRSPRRAGAQGLGPVSLWEPPPRGRRGAWQTRLIAAWALDPAHAAPTIGAAFQFFRSFIYVMRILLFLATNLAVVLVASITLSLLGVGSIHDGQGGMNLQALLIF